jgi:hypothetical protein
MQFRSTPRAESPTHQQLYKRNGSPSITRRPGSITPTRHTPNSSNGFALAVVPPGTSSRRGGRTGAPADDMVYVADVNPVYSVTATVRAFIPVNDRIMWSAEFDGSLCVRALPKGTPLRTLPGREGTCCISLLYVPDVEQVWAGFQDGYLHVYEARTMELVTEVMGHAGGLHAMTQVEDSIFTGGADWKVCQWSFEEGSPQLLRTLHGHRGGVRSFGVYDGPTGAVLFSGSDDETIRAWDPYMSVAGGSDSEAANIHTFTGHDRAVLSLAVVSHVNQLWSGGEDMTVRVWDMQTLECLSVLRSGHTAPIANLMVVESRVWSADKHGHILLWDITTRSLLQDLADRVPYWGIGQGMILAMQKVQPTSAYKVWTAASNGVLQCWNAETIPIIFDDVPIAAGVCRHPAGAGGAQAITAGGGAVGGVAADSSVASTPNPRGADAVAADVSALTVSTNNNSSSPAPGEATSSPAQTAAAARMQDYVERLQRDLQCAQRDAKLNYEKYRLEVQLEVETQQLLAQENARLRDRVAELEAMAGIPHEDVSVEPLGSVQSARHNNTQAAAQQQRSGPTVAETEAWRAEIDELHRQLDEAHRQLDEALRSLRQQQQDAGTTTQSQRDGSQRETSSAIDVADLASTNATDPSRQFVRQDDTTKLPSVTDDNLSDSAALQGSRAARQPYSAILSQPHESQWKEGAITRTSLDRHLTGEHWGYLLNEKPYELHSTLTADLCAGLGVAPTQLERVDVHDDDGLTVEVDVVHPVTVPSAELRRRMRDYRFPGITQMHDDAFTTSKTGPDTAEATIVDLQGQLVQLKKALESAQDELEAQQARVVEPSPEPQQPYSSSNMARPGQLVLEDPASTTAAAEQQHLKEANAKLQDKLQDQLRTIQQLTSAVEERDNALVQAQQQIQEEQEQHARVLRDLQQQQQQLMQTPNALRLRDSGDFQGQRLYDSAAPPAVEGTARKETRSESGRPTELIAVPLAQEMSAAAATGATERARDVTSPLVSDDATTQRFVAQLQQALKEAKEKLAALETEKKRADAETSAALEQLRDENAQLTWKLQVQSTAPPPPSSPLQSQQQQQLQAKAAAAEKRSAELQRTNDTLQKKVDDLTKKMTAVEQQLQAERQKLAAAAAATPAALARAPQPIQSSASTERINNTGSLDNEALQQLRDDHEALKRYLRDQLKPLISRLKRARGELQLDKDRLVQRLTAAETAAASVVASAPATPAKRQGSNAAIGDGKPQKEASITASRAAQPPSEDDTSVQQLREDYEALDKYLHDQLKPMISRLKRARGELQFDLSRAQDDLQHACDMYEEAAAALDEARVREEKMGETMEALRKALEAEQQKIQNTTANARLQSETPAGRPTLPAQLHNGTSDVASDEWNGGAAAKDSAAAAAAVAPSSRGQAGSNAPDVVDRLAAQNLDLSVRLADAETVIAQLHSALGESAAQLTRQRDETQRLLSKINKYHQGGRSHSENVPSVSTSDSQ